MDNHWRSILGKGRLVKVLFILVLFVFFHLIQIGTNLEGHTKQLRSEAHFGHEHKAQHTTATEDDNESSSDFDDQIPLSNEEEDGLASESDIDDPLSTLSDKFFDETLIKLANEQQDDDANDFRDYEDKGDDEQEEEDDDDDDYGDTDDDEQEEEDDDYGDTDDDEQEEEDDDYGDTDDDELEEEDDDYGGTDDDELEEADDDYGDRDDDEQEEADDDYGDTDDDEQEEADDDYGDTDDDELEEEEEDDDYGDTDDDELEEADDDYGDRDDDDDADVDVGTSLSNKTEIDAENDEPQGKLKVSADLTLTLLWNETNSTAMLSTNGTGISIASKSNSTNAIEVKDTTVTDYLLLEKKQEALYEAAKAKFDANRSFRNESTFNTVNREIYQNVVEKAQVSVKSVIEDVYTDCEIYILPSAVEVGNPLDRPRVQFKCLDDGNATLRDDICHTANMCRVVLAEDAWKIVPSNSTTDQQINTKKSALLTMLDTAEYLMQADNFNSFMNKASYAHRSDRPFYVWIGNIDQQELNRREVETLEPAFGFSCAVKTVENSRSYYKPLAFLVLFEMLASSPQKSDSIFYLDIDSSFNPAAFERIGDDKFDDSENENILGTIGPESYLGLSPQASLMATTNEGGKSLMNSGLMILRDTRWAREFSSLWWYGRCGSQDHLSLWLTLYATWSAWTEGQTQFAYPGEIFFDYMYAKNKLFMHFRKYAHSLQASWEDIVGNEGGMERDEEDDYMYPVPTNTELYNGGSESLGPKLYAPMELPHVVILSPMSSVSYNRTEVTPEEVVDLLRLKGDADSSLVLSAKDSNSCSRGRCWPYIQN